MQMGIGRGNLSSPAAGRGRHSRSGPSRAVAGRGLEGDRYFAGDGTFFKERKPGQDLTLIEAEAIEALARETGIELAPGRVPPQCRDPRHRR